MFSDSRVNAKLDVVIQWQKELEGDITQLRQLVGKLISVSPDAMIKKLDEIIGRVKDIQRQERMEMAKVDDLLAKLAELTTVEDGVLTLCTTLHQMLSDAKTDPAKLDEAMALLDQRKQVIADNIVANTPAA